MKQKLIEAIAIQIDEVFNNSTIYTNHINQNFKKNSFFIRITKNSEKPYLAKRFKVFNKIEIVYTPEETDDTSKKLNEISQNLFESMKLLKYENGYINAENMECQIKDGILLFFLEYNFYIFRFEDTEKMEKLSFKGDIKWKKKKNILKKNF